MDIEDGSASRPFEIPGCAGSTVERFAHDPATARWELSATDGVSLAIYCTWQVVDRQRVRVADGDDGQTYGLQRPVDAAALALELLGGESITRVEADPRYGDLRIEFGTGVVLRVFADSSGYEAWQLGTREGVEWSAQGGGRVVRL